MNKMSELDSKILLDMMLEICEKGKREQSLKGKHLVHEFVRRLQPFYGVRKPRTSGIKGACHPPEFVEAAADGQDLVTNVNEKILV
jgi:hypothetical protein